MSSTAVPSRLPTPVVPTPASGRAAVAGEPRFAATLRAAAAGERAARAREAAAALVATAFVQPILAEARASSIAEGPFAPGPAERRFGGLLDQQIAERIVNAASFPLVDELARRLLGRAATDRSTPTDGGPA